MAWSRQPHCPLWQPGIDQCLPAGNGAGTVVLAGPGAEHLLGQAIAILLGRPMRNIDAQPRPMHRPARWHHRGARAAAFVNPVTALAMLETMRMDGQLRSSIPLRRPTLGKCSSSCARRTDALVNIVRNDEQAAILRDIGAEHVCNSTDASFMADLIAAIDATGATLAFDARAAARWP